MSIKQYIIIRKDAPTITGDPISASKVAVIVAHASSAFLLRPLMDASRQGNESANISLNGELKEWLGNNYVKVLLGAKTKDFLKLPKKAEEFGLKENADFFCVRDICRTELVPDEDENTCFVAVGFRPMDEERMKPLVKRLQLYG